ncbi:hypothetical protein LEM8419_01939 [Neolewinella maritima]|uniref:Uncharacterized protein n=1 Tax=Neolewinella maritima TaxID=1383882 RepID=A0ABN8F4S0_9BACT|nr:hypothetical protein [Neolewinella maritima]CAH1000896.1 hypothetical protein LEM8419_01939 [Neolewinella maritima]
MDKKAINHFGIYCEVNNSDFLIESFARTEKFLLAVKALRDTSRQISYYSESNAEVCALFEWIGKSYLNSIKVITSHSSDIGCAILPNMSHFKCNFDLSLDTFGIVSVMSEDIRNEILIDYELVEDKRYLVEVEIYGREWSKLFDLWTEERN